MRPFLAAAAAALALIPALALLPAAAQAGNCIGADEGQRMLFEEYGEQPVARGIADGRLVLLFTSADGSTWTMAAVDPAHDAICIIAAGDSWDGMEIQAPGRSS